MGRILLTGADGQVGRELQQVLPRLGEVVGVTRAQLDLSQGEQIRQLIQQIQPDGIINSAAYTAVDRAEREPTLAQAVNALAPTIMAEEAAKIGAFLCHLSTDYVFNGQKNTPYGETDPTAPLSIYGQTKLAGERGIEQVGDRYLILRTAWVYGVYGKSNFVKTMLRLGQEREELRVVADQVGSPTWAGDIASAIIQLRQTEATGIYHFTNSGVASWYDFAIAIFEEARSLGFPLKVQRVLPITTADYPTPATRPAYSVLSSKKFVETVGNYPPYWRASLRKMIQQLQEINSTPS
ncbi:MAG: dTDP-4-dehydrorhamnose reductase [Snowella sp.]|nr:dTDP-4-dehydrorhamnose reductase [Snowella sp.]